MTYLVTGATGKAGRWVVEHLLREGVAVRALTRDPANARLPERVEVVAGDLTDPATLDGVFDGVVGAHLLTTGGADGAGLRTGPELAALAEKAGVRRVTLLWNGRVGPVEEAFAASGVEWTSLRPVDFMGNVRHWAPAIRDEGAVREPFADVPSGFVDEYDVGAVAAAVLVRGGHAGRSYVITGPRPLSKRERLAAISSAIGRPLRLVELSEEEARERWRRAGFDDDFLEVYAAWQSAPPPETVAVSPAVREITGREPRTFERWLADNAGIFR
ncbi:NAD(P)H-binding protein [Bailinhaonella thermotolerans]|uniref:NAD-dependent epimerase/dehydratase family protein n=1 Tax=Bailinhaonella thermotolerans TaxID=1070861 RepID=A0A3A4BLY2_9ACTN|nr:NAD(P)H-binding protein [Bailinhaonella thermotolerans]RJL32032.1 NAD-dependent epimerase/dehydratase family protein [Bailinhaonella thermotolerans]